MYYPKECFSINMTLTRQRMAEYDRKRAVWYEAAERLYPTYHKMSPKERRAVRREIDKAVGFSL